MRLEITGVWLPNPIHRRTCNCVLQHYMQNFKTTQLRLMNQKFYAHSSDFCFILAFKASICRSSACCFIFSCFSWSFFLFFSSSCCSANFFARIFSRISNGGSERTEMLQLSEGLWHKKLTPPELLLQGLHQLQHLIISSGQKPKGIDSLVPSSIIYLWTAWAWGYEGEGLGDIDICAPGPAPSLQYANIGGDFSFLPVSLNHPSSPT